MKCLEYDIRHFPFSRYGAMVAVSQDLVKDELVLHDVRAHDWQDRALKVLFFNQSIKAENGMNGVIDGWVPFESKGTPSKLYIKTENGQAEFVISGDHCIHIYAENLSLVLTTCRNDETTGCMKDERHFEFVCSETCRYNRIDVARGEMSAIGPYVLQFGISPVERLNTVILNPENGIIDFEIQIAQSPKKIDPVVPINECCQKANDEWERFLSKMPSVPEKYREYSEKAWFALWAAYVRAQPPYHDDTILMSKKLMSAVWSWDHCFNALAVGKADAQLGMNQLMVPFYLQQEDGSLPDRFSPDSVLWGCSKPPVHGWCMTRLMSWHDYDEKILKEVYTHFAKWTNWWLEYRVYHPDSLPGYPRGCDSGLDNSTCFDKGDFIESADLSAYLALQMNCLSDIAHILNDEKSAAQWKKRSESLIEKMIVRLWDGKRFTPYLCSTQERINDTQSILLYLPLVLGDLLPSDIADIMIAEMKKNNLTENGLASEGPLSAKYDSDGYWRGPIWAPTTYLIVDGMRRKGRIEEAREIARRFCDMCVDKAHGFYENFDALTGKGLRTPGYTWTASAFLCMVWDFLT